MTTYEYIVASHNDKYPFNAESIDSIWDLDDDELEETAAEAASDYFDNHDGWESKWPLTFELFLDGKSLGTFRVKQETMPVFRAEKL